MDLLVLDKDFMAVTVVDSFESMIWTDRYTSCGDFELYLPMNLKHLDWCKKDYYLWQRNSEHMMIIDRLEIESDIETGIHLIVTAKSLEYLLDRRIVWNDTVLSGDFVSCVKKLITESITNPSISERKIPNFIFKDPTDPRLFEIQYQSEELYGTSVYEVVKGMCERHKVGFKVTLDNDNNFVFELYLGQDRSYNQLANPFVIFSPKFDNMINSEYFETNEDYRNVALVHGEEKENEARKTVTVGEASGLYRRELYVDGRSVKTKDDNDNDIPLETYMQNLREKGLDDLREHRAITSFTGETEVHRSFKFGTDYFMGDIVQVEDAYGHDNEAYITELIFSQDDTGYNVYPTFEVVNEEEVSD